jgi:hypothetical protein
MRQLSNTVVLAVHRLPHEENSAELRSADDCAREFPEMEQAVMRLRCVTSYENGFSENAQAWINEEE